VWGEGGVGDWGYRWDGAVENKRGWCVSRTLRIWYYFERITSNRSWEGSGAPFGRGSVLGVEGKRNYPNLSSEMAGPGMVRTEGKGAKREVGSIEKWSLQERPSLYHYQV